MVIFTFSNQSSKKKIACTKNQPILTSFFNTKIALLFTQWWFDLNRTLSTIIFSFLFGSLLVYISAFGGDRGGGGQLLLEAKAKKIKEKNMLACLTLYTCIYRSKMFLFIYLILIILFFTVLFLLMWRHLAIFGREMTLYFPIMFIFIFLIVVCHLKRTYVHTHLYAECVSAFVPTCVCARVCVFTISGTSIYRISMFKKICIYSYHYIR